MVFRMYMSHDLVTLVHITGVFEILALCESIKLCPDYIVVGRSVVTKVSESKQLGFCSDVDLPASACL